ncbi:MAG: hypothetical protein AB1499_14560 [Nitrospirota bacterium]
MAIEGVGNTYVIPEVKQERETAMNKKKNNQKNEKDKKRDQDEKQGDIKERRIDIRI